MNEVKQKQNMPCGEKQGSYHLQLFISPESLISCNVSECPAVYSGVTRQFARDCCSAHLLLTEENLLREIEVIYKKAVNGWFENTN